MAAPTVQELKKALQKAGFEVYRTRGDEVHLAERPRENLIMDSGVAIAIGEPVRVKLVVRAQKADFEEDDEAALFARARAIAKPAIDRGFTESSAKAQPVRDPGDATRVLDTWYEVMFEKRASSLEEAMDDLRFALKLEKAAQKGLRRAQKRAERPVPSDAHICYAPRLLRMEAFRSQGLKGAIYGAAVIAVGFVFVTQFKPAWLRQGSGGGMKHECVAEVRGDCISNREFRAEMSLLAGRADEDFIKKTQLRRHVVDGLVERNLLAADAERLGITISDDDLNAALTSGQALVSLGVDTPDIVVEYHLRLNPDRPMRLLRVKNSQGQFDEKTYVKELRAAVGRTPQDFREQQRTEHLAARMRDIVRSHVRISDDEAVAAYERRKATASIKYVLVSRDWVGEHLAPTDDELAKFAGEHTKEIDGAWDARKGQILPECRTTRIIAAKWGSAASDEEKTAARKRIDAARERIQKGAFFGDVARDASEDDSAKKGGFLGCFVKGKMPKPVEDAVASAKVGDTSDVVETEDGFYLVKVEAALKDKDAEEEAKREIARELYEKIEGDAKASELAKKIQADVAGGRSLEDALDAALASFTKPSKKKSDDAKKDDAAKKPDDARPKVAEAKDFTADGTPITGVLVPDIAALAFAIKKPGDVADDVVKIEGPAPAQIGYAVLQLEDKKVAPRAELDKDPDKFVGGLLAAKRHDALVAYVQRLRSQAANEIKINQAYVTEKGPADDGSGE